MKMNRQTGASSALVLGLIVLLVAGVVVYFVSDPLRSKADEAYRQFAEWTPENIAKNPVGYLDFCEEQCEDTLESLRASEIAIAQKRAELAGMEDRASSKATTGERALDELKTIYREHEASQTWPVKWNGQDRDRDFVRRQIMSLHKQTESKTALRDKVALGLKKLEAQKSKINEARATCKEQLAQIKTDREMLKVEKITEDLTTKLFDLRGVLQATIATASESSGVVSLDELAADSAAAIDDTEFDKILNQ